MQANNEIADQVIVQILAKGWKAEWKREKTRLSSLELR
jgi:hypothetical protein